MRIRLRSLVIENFSYKVVSLLIALILWFTILGRRDFTLSKVIEVEVIPRIEQVVTTQSTEHIKVKVSGPRTALKKFMDSGLSQMVTIDVSQLSDGEYELPVPINKIDVPFGVKVISVKPASVKVFLQKKRN